MRVRMIAKVTGTRDGIEWPEVGDSLDVPDTEAEFLMMAGLAEAAAPEPEAKAPTKGK